MMKKTTVLALVLGLAAAIAIPGTAAATWKHHDTPIQKDVDLGLTGNFGFVSEVGGAQCSVKLTATFFAGQTTGQVDTYELATKNPTADCQGSGGLAFCDVHAVEATNLPWTFHTVGTGHSADIVLTTGDIHLVQTGGFCPYKHATSTAGDAILQPFPFSGTTVTKVEIETIVQGKQIQGHLYNATPQPLTQDGQATLTLNPRGTLTIDAPNSGTYSI